MLIVLHDIMTVQKLYVSVPSKDPITNQYFRQLTPSSTSLEVIFLGICNYSISCASIVCNMLFLFTRLCYHLVTPPVNWHFCTETKYIFCLFCIFRCFLCVNREHYSFFQRLHLVSYLYYTVLTGDFLVTFPRIFFNALQEIFFMIKRN